MRLCQARSGLAICTPASTPQLLPMLVMLLLMLLLRSVRRAGSPAAHSLTDSSRRPAQAGSRLRTSCRGWDRGSDSSLLAGGAAAGQISCRVGRPYPRRSSKAPRLDPHARPRPPPWRRPWLS